MMYQQNRITEKANAETNGIVTQQMWVVKQRQAGVVSLKEGPSEETYYKNIPYLASNHVSDRLTSRNNVLYETLSC